MTTPRFTFLSILLLMLLSGFANAQHITLLQQGKPTSIRGLSVVDDNVAWISGSKGYIAITINGGKTWAWQQVKGFELADFRDIEAFSAKEAVIMSSGTPALVLKTTDGGANWQLHYKNTDSAYFLDAMDFADAQHGFILADPIKNRFTMLETNDGGDTWRIFDNSPVALPGEAAFAASGTCLRVTSKQKIYIATGGTYAEVDMPKPTIGWSHHQVPLLQGKAATGAFSLAVDRDRLVVVGGDYQHDKRRDSTACYSTNQGITWHLAQASPAGFQSGVEYIYKSTFLSTGTSGSNLSINGGQTWTKIDSVSYNVCRKAKAGKLVLLAGAGGKIAIFKQ